MGIPMNRASAASAREALTVQLMGGLGNQMFIAAFGTVAAGEFNRRLVFDTSALVNTATDVRPAVFEFPFWKQYGETKAAFSGARRYIDAAGRRLGVHRRWLFQEHEETPDLIGFDTTWRRVQMSTRARGYFQSWRYWEGRFDEVREWFSSPHENPIQRLIASEVGEHFLAAHVRRGDYLESVNRERIGVCKDAYYLAGLRQLRSEGFRDLPVVLFTDSPGLLDKDLLQVADLVVGPAQSGTPGQTLLALSGATGLIMSNSSFSWWAGFLGESAQRPVVAPDPWFSNVPHHLEDLLLPHWRRRASR